MSKKEKTAGIILYILALCCAFYGVKVFLGGAGTGFFLIWPVIGAMLAGLGFAVRRSVLKRLPKAVKISLCILLCAAILLFAVVEGFIFSRFFESGKENLDYLIVLGAQVYKDGPSPILRYRLDRAIEYLKENPDTVCIVTGGQGYNEPFPEAVGMERYLLENGIPQGRILAETKSENTYQNLSFAKELMEKENASVGVVTNNFHVFRAVRTAGSLGLDDVYGIAVHTPVGFLPNNLLREFFGVLKYFITA